MTDLAFELLRDELNSLDTAAGVWVVDENISSENICQIHPRKNLLAITNRFDAYTQLQAQGIRAVINDFDLTCEGPVEAIFYRISKEKAIVHHVINAAQVCLKEEGSLYISGYKNEGIKTYISKAALLFDDQPEKSNGGKTSQIARLEKSLAVTPLLDDKNYEHFSALLKKLRLLLSREFLVGIKLIEAVLFWSIISRHFSADYPASQKLSPILVVVMDICPS
jgi:16S rRNA (guanine1207-N2)-methyltransferase